MALGAEHEPSVLQNLLDAMEARMPRLSANPPQLGGKVLLVEDDLDHQPLLALMLRKAGAEVVIAENGRVAIDAACAAREAGCPFDVILMDVQMPVLDGFAATRELRAAGFDNPIIALTARALSSDRDKCIAAGCDDFLAKPISREDLIRQLNFHLRRFRDRREATQN